MLHEGLSWMFYDCWNSTRSGSLSVRNASCTLSWWRTLFCVVQFVSWNMKNFFSCFVLIFSSRREIFTAYEAFSNEGTIAKVKISCVRQRKTTFCCCLLMTNSRRFVFIFFCCSELSKNWWNNRAINWEYLTDLNVHVTSAGVEQDVIV